MSDRARPTPVALYHLARPAGAFWVGTLPLTGFGLAHWDNAWNLRNGPQMIGVFAAWMALHTGTMWLNATLDRDEGEVLFGRSVAVPEHTRLAGRIALLVAVVLAGWADPVAGILAGACAVLAVLYSHPATAWKGHPIAGPAVNLLGYGILSPWTGIALVNPPVSPRLVAGSGLLVAWVTGSYFAAQAFQGEEDAARGYRTFVVTHGPRATLAMARSAFALGFGALILMSAAGWFPRLLLLVAFPAWSLDRWLAHWQQQTGGGDARWARGMVRRLILAGLCVLGLALVQYAVDLSSGGPVSGRATALPAYP